MGIVTPPRGSKGAAPILNGPQGGGAPAAGGIAPPLRESGKSRPSTLTSGGNSIPGYGTVLGGPYQPTAPAQGRRSSQSPLH